jgi:hypothetical protein
VLILQQLVFPIQDFLINKLYAYYYSESTIKYQQININIMDLNGVDNVIHLFFLALFSLF